jgi:fructokinase
MKKYVVGIGEALWDVLLTVKKLGGAPANFAYHAGRMGYDALAISAVGIDALGDEILDVLRQKNLEHLMPRVDYPTGTVQVTVDDRGIPSYEIKQHVAWDHIPFTSEMEAVARECRAVCFGSLAQRSPESRATILRFLDTVSPDCLKIFDINLRQQFYTRDIIEESLRRCNILKINDEELDIITPMLGKDKQQLIRDYQLSMLVLTCGTEGSYIFTTEEESFLPTPKVDVVDTVGAGDSFTGAFVASLLSGKSIREAHQMAVEVSAFVCTQAGAMP